MAPITREDAAVAVRAAAVGGEVHSFMSTLGATWPLDAALGAIAGAVKIEWTDTIPDHPVMATGRSGLVVAFKAKS